MALEECIKVMNFKKDSSKKDNSKTQQVDVESSQNLATTGWVTIMLRLELLKTTRQITMAK